MQFQSRTGSTGHLAYHIFFPTNRGREVSIPNGLPRPFCLEVEPGKVELGIQFPSRLSSPGHLARELYERLGASDRVSIPTGLPWPVNRYLCRRISFRVGVSIPNGSPGQLPS